MAGEALQILNLSPIPELSEVELSNVLEQFSELSELTGDLTDRNVEDILREAEELLDMSSSVKEMSEEIQNDDSKANEELEIKVQETNLSDEKKSEDKVMKSPEQPLSARLISPSSSKNHIKSTIDSLKECSKIIEDQINSKTDCKKEEKHAKSNKNLPSYDVPTKINKVFTRLTSPVQKQSKNLSIPGKQKHIKQLSKTANVRKTFNDFKSGPSNSVCKNKLQSKGIIEKRKKSPFCSPTQGSPIELQKNKHYECLDFKYGDENEIDFEKCIALLDKELLLGKNDSKFAEQLLKDSKESVSMLQKEIADLKAQLLKNTVRDRNSELEQTFRAQKDLISSLKEENTKLFQEIKEIKGQMRITENLEKTLKDKQDVIENLRSEIESLRDCVMSKANSSPGLSRLEERFQVIKDKYNQQTEKLELENQQLKHALNHPHVEHDNDFSHNQDSEEKLGKEIGVQTEISPVLKPTKLIRSTSFENWRSGKPKLWDNVRSLENGNGEAICQTERETRNASVQSEEISAPKEKKIPADHVLEPRKIDNKENMVGKPPKPNLDRKKGMSEHELHLMATLRGLHAEILAKDKENRKLKNELDTLKNQTKKLGGDAGKKKTVQSKKKIHAGTQTIGLGHCVPAAYDPALFQVSKELENENEELKAKIKALEEEGVQLKNKRISDLQILQEIHEQEMAKLESKLQSQTALAKHLHTLLLNR